MKHPRTLSRTRLTRLTLGLLVCALAALALTRSLVPQSAPSETVSAQRVTLGDFVREVSGSGVVVARQSATLGFNLEGGGRVEELLVAEGDWVKKGQLLARIQTDAKRAQLESDQLLLDSQRAKRAVSPETAQLKRLELESVVQSAVFELEKTRQALRGAELKDTLQAQLLEKGVISREERAEAARALSDLRAQFEQLEVKSELAERELAHYQDGLNEESLATDAEIARLEASLRGLNEQLAAAEVRAPFAGVISSVPFKVGESAGDKGIELMNPRRLFVRASFSEGRAAELAERQTATVIPDADPHARFDARLTQVGVSAVRDAAQERAQVAAQLELAAQASQKLKPGYSVSVLVAVSKMPETLLVPLEAVYLTPEGSAVYRIVRERGFADEGVIETLAVRVLERNDIAAAVEPLRAPGLEPLQTDDLLVTSSFETLQEGTRVRYEETLGEPEQMAARP